MDKEYENLNIFDINYEDGEKFSLESILAEYKGSAYIDGDKKTPSDVLNAKAEAIILEASGSNPPSPELPSGDLPGSRGKQEPVVLERRFEDTTRLRKQVAQPTELEMPKEITTTARTPAQSAKFVTADQETVRTDRRQMPRRPTQVPADNQTSLLQQEEPSLEESDTIRLGGKLAELTRPETDETIKIGRRHRIESGEQKHNEKPKRKTIENLRPESDKSVNADASLLINADVLSDDDVRFFETYNYAAAQSLDEFEKQVSSVVEEEEEIEEETVEALGLFGRLKARRQEMEQEEQLESFEDEPNYLDASKDFARGSHSLMIRGATAFLICVAMAVFTYMSEAGKSLPFGIGSDQLLVSGVLLLMQFTVMFLGIDILIRGIVDLFRAEPGAESLVAISSLITALSAAFSLLYKNTDTGLPFSAVSSFALMFAMWGEKMYKTALKETLRSAVAVSSPYSVKALYGQINELTILKKSENRTEGFYFNLLQEDICEYAYRHLTPILLIASLLFAILSSIGHGRPQYFAWFFAAILSGSASFSALTAFSAPFSMIAKRAKRSGAAIAGWGGVCDIYYSDGAFVTDDDIFPPGSLTINSVKVFEGIQPQKAIKLTATLVIASGSGLAKPFAELLKEQGMSVSRVDDFTCYEGGGIGAVIKGERVLTGSAGFMNLMGIRIPNSINIKNAVFTAINDELVAAFAVNYVPVKSVQSALLSILNTKVNMYFAMRDFNISPLMLQQKYKVSMDGIEYLPIQDSYRVTEDSPTGRTRAAAVLCREGLLPLAEAITSGRQLKTVATLTTTISVVGSVIGLLVMFFLSWNGAFHSASAGNILIYLLSVQVAVLIVSTFVRRKN